MNENTNPTAAEPAAAVPLICPRCGARLVPGERCCPCCGLRTDLNPPVPRPATMPFSASRRELLAALVTYLLAWLYLYRSGLFLDGLFVDLWLPLSQWPLSIRLWSLTFVLGFVALTELIHWRTPRPKESWIWLGCMGLITGGILLGRDAVWEDWPTFFLHLAAVWWVLSRSGRLLEGESGHLLPLDGLNGFILFPFKHFFLRIRTLIYSAVGLLKRRRHLKGATLLWSLLALLAAAVLFVIATDLLMDADADFKHLMGRIGTWFRFDWNRAWFWRFVLSLPVGQYLFGLIAGTGREEPEKLRDRSRRICAGLEQLRRVPNLVWTLLTGAFCLLYLVFFAVQSRYLFGAFTRTLPEGFIVSEYARRGFFELCKVMAVNFALLWLVTRASRTPVRENRPALILCLILLAESMLFAVVAFSKLALYIDCFGFTPLRLQSSWLVCVLFAGCLAAGWTLCTGKKSLRAWLVFSAVSLSALCLV